MKKSAVEWYEIEIDSLFKKYEEKEISYREFIIMKHNLFYQAKEMEKQYIVSAFEIGYENGACTNENESIYHGGNYYNLTFKSE